MFLGSKKNLLYIDVDVLILKSKHVYAAGRLESLEREDMLAGR